MTRFRHQLRRQHVQVRLQSMTFGGDEINWSAIDHAYGPASDVPALIDRVRGDP
jgi:hypothetical protein